MTMEKGRDWLYYLNTGTVASPTWTLIERQKDGSMGITQNLIDTTTKSDSGWTSQTATTRDGSFSFSIIYDQTEATHVALLSAAINQTLKQFKVVGFSGENWIFQAYVDFDAGFPVDNMVEVTCNLGRYDAPVYAAS